MCSSSPTTVQPSQGTAHRKVMQPATLCCATRGVVSESTNDQAKQKSASTTGTSACDPPVGRTYRSCQASSPPRQRHAQRKYMSACRTSSCEGGRPYGHEAVEHMGRRGSRVVQRNKKSLRSHGSCFWTTTTHSFDTSTPQPGTWNTAGGRDEGREAVSS